MAKKQTPKVPVFSFRDAQKRMRAVVREQGMSVRALATAMGVSRTTIDSWLTSDQRSAEPEGPTMANLYKFAETTRTSADWLLGYDVPRDADARRLVTPTLDVAELRLAVRAYLRRAIKREPDVRIHDETIEQLLADPDPLEELASEYVLQAIENEIARRNVERRTETATLAALFADPERRAIVMEALENQALNGIKEARRRPMPVANVFRLRPRRGTHDAAWPALQKSAGAGDSVPRKPPSIVKRKRPGTR